MGKQSNLVGQCFGFLQVEEKMPYTEERYYVWRCQCLNCGGETFVSTRKLKNKITTNCGCIPKIPIRKGSIAEDLTGQTFGRLKVLRQVESCADGHARWMCECICKKKMVVSARNLKTGRTKDCGCVKKRLSGHCLDLQGRQFKRLTALYPTEKREKKGSVIWHCKCSCGNELEVSADALLHGNYYSCGCLKKEIQKNIVERLHLIDGTCVEWLESRKSRCDNTSGFRGVYPVASGRFAVKIGFKKHVFHIGTYDTFEEAVQIRVEAEKIFHNGFTDAYYRWSKRAKEDSSWAHDHPFYYDVKSENNQFLVSTILQEDYRE
ncbi:transcriptional regulator [Hespellia stercorisuis]|uniref:AP2 domain-containing protein n=1 Tax=Hespellia stercorisuis DSM 15480 TaxID=1121950 RepID=A0A1M6I9C7_9FIRM|nr:transcriptional regulator [Hespellia stercorisuis]SHJ31099.1 hypothetical protein SAMN02745243_00284 [Hespellia stercorisuis DSM 15480]